MPSLLAQLINFTLLLTLLTVLAYKPLLRVMDERRRRIQEGLDAADESKRRLSDTEKAVAEEFAKGAERKDRP